VTSFDPVVLVVPLSPESFAEAADLLASSVPELLRAERQQQILAYFQSLALDPNHVYLARESAQGPLAGVLVTQQTPGRTASMQLPTLASYEQPHRVADALCRAAVRDFERHHMAYAQVMVPLDRRGETEMLQQQGFRFITRLQHLAKPAPFALWPPSNRKPRLAFRSCDDSQADEFAQLLLKTYEGSLDVPEAGSDRTAAELLADIRDDWNEGSEWWACRDSRGRDVGVGLLAAHDEADGEIGYLGLIPEARGTGLGQEILAFLENRSRLRNWCNLHLRVDGRNRPALQLYLRSGFELVTEQEVYLWVRSPG
jgi:ribosomal protein S18 acetylase RimI-like enzyme